MYTISDLEVLTKLHRKTIKKYRDMGILTGNYCEGKWGFSTNQVIEFLSCREVSSVMRKKQFAFWNDYYNLDKTRIVLSCDIPFSELQMSLDDIFYTAINSSQDKEVEIGVWICDKSILRIMVKGYKINVYKWLMNSHEFSI